MLYTLFNIGFIIGLITGIDARLIGANQTDAFYSGLVGAFGGALAAPIHSIMTDYIDSNRLLAVRLFAIILASALVRASGNASIGAAMGAIGGAFIGSLIARVLSRKAIKLFANATMFAISLGGLVGTAVGSVGGAVPGTISGTIAAGAVTITFDNLETIYIFRTVPAAGTFGETVKTVTGFIMALPRKDAYAIFAVTILGAILNYSLNYYNLMVGDGLLIGTAVGAVGAIAFYVKHPNATDPIRIFYLIILFLIAFYLKVTNSGFGVGPGIIGALGGLIFAAVVSRALIRPPDNPRFNLFQYKTIFAAIAAICAAVHIMFYFLFVYINRLFTHSVDFPAPVGRTVLVATTGAAIGGFLLAAVVNMAGLRRVDGVFTRLSNDIDAIFVIPWESCDVLGMFILRALGFVGIFTTVVIELIAREMLTGVPMAAILGATMAIASGAVTTVAVAIIKSITVPATTKMCTAEEIKTIIVIATVSAFIGGVCGGYFTSSVVAGGLVALAFPVVTMVMYTAHLYAERRHRFKRVNWVPLVRVMNKFGIELRTLTSEETQNNWIRYKIAKVQ
jgi:hypothetical protein